MNLFQIVVVPLFLVLSIERFVAMRRRSGSRGIVLMWALVWLLAALAVAFPRWTTNVARAFGIERGADLALYSGVMVTFLGFFMCYLRMRKIESELTQLVRRLAISNPQWPQETA